MTEAEELAALRCALRELVEQWKREADALDEVWADLFGEGYPETDYAIEARLRRQCAFQLAARLAAPEEPQ